MDWHEWHRDYEGDTPLARRLLIVQAHIRELLSESESNTVGVISICAGDGRDIVGALDHHPAASRVRGRLLELDTALAATATARVAQEGLAFEVVEADAGCTDAYTGAVPADLLLACGVFGNISDADVQGTIRLLPMLLAPGGTVIWTRTRREPDLTPAIRGWLAAAGFEEVDFTPVPPSLASVGVHRLAGPPIVFQPGVRLFEFVRTE